jgi:hypothetical protein
LELDFEWDTPEDLVLQALAPVLDIILRTVKEHYQLEDETPAHLISMRTCYKVHLNFPGSLAPIRRKVLDHRLCRNAPLLAGHTFPEQEHVLLHNEPNQSQTVHCAFTRILI